MTGTEGTVILNLHAKRKSGRQKRGTDMISVNGGGVTIRFDEETLCCEFARGKGNWKWRADRAPALECRHGTVLFSAAKIIRHQVIKNGVGEGILSHYEGFGTADGAVCGYAFETLIWIEAASGHVRCEWIPLSEEGLEVKAVFWPVEMEFEEPKKSWYTLINEEQGILIPNTWETELRPVMFEGRFCTAGSYMPWFAQVKDKAGCLVLCETPWNAGYEAEHPAGGPYTHIRVRLEPSLGKMDYRRIVRYTFLDDCDYNDICKEYRRYAMETGLFRSLAEKAEKNPSVDRLIGCAVMHTGIKKSVQPESRFYDREHPENNESVIPFSVHEREVRELYKLGVRKLYLHLDGWGQPGYDNQHPDYTPACTEAGGWDGMRSLADTMRELGFLFGIHDQYRDYYKRARTFDPEYACMLPDGTIPGHHTWAGGEQAYLCATQAPYYVKRNFTELKEHGIRPDCAYLDVFTCNEGDECSNPRHRMTRRECYEYRGRCFSYLLSEQILTSSEEVSDWSMPELIFCHYAPYDFMLRKPGSPKYGIPVPLFNLVYHDCLVIPWMMDRIGENEDYMLYALLNGGIPYLLRDGAYPGTDGAFSDGQRKKLLEDIERCRVVSQLHERVAKQEMIRHELLSEDGTVQRSIFADQTAVTVNLSEQTYSIETCF